MTLDMESHQKKKHFNFLIHDISESFFNYNWILKEKLDL